MGREHGLEVSDHGMVKCRGQQDDMGTVSKGHLELWHQKKSIKQIGETPVVPRKVARASRWDPTSSAHEMCGRCSLFFFNGRFHGTMMNTGCS